MAIQPAICSSCGGNIKVDDVDLHGFCVCEYCQTPHKVIDIITIDGLPTVKSLLTNAEMLLVDGNADKAVEMYKEVLKIKPNCHEAWWGLYVCNRFYDRYYQYRDKYGNSGPLTKASIMASTIEKYALRAIEYAPKDVKDSYRAEIQPELDYIKQAQEGQFDNRSSGKSGCYIATAVYGSYYCSEVMALRRYRDDYLAKHLFGRMFIKVYYALSPSMAKRIKKDSFLGKKIRLYLDKKIERLSL